MCNTPALRFVRSHDNNLSLSKTQLFIILQNRFEFVVDITALKVNLSI